MGTPPVAERRKPTHLSHDSPVKAATTPMATPATGAMTSAGGATGRTGSSSSTRFPAR